MESTTNSSAKVDVYQIVTNRMIELLEAGTLPWQKPWTEPGIPMNAISKRPYRGINLWLLLSLDYERNLFLTWDQLKKIGGSVKHGEHGHVVIFWKTQKKEEADGQEKKHSLLRYYKVFNIAQCKDLPEGFVEPIEKEEHNVLKECKVIIDTMPQRPPIATKGREAFYHILEDYITMPSQRMFKTKESYYAVLFHELVHSTGHEKRLNRPSIAEMAEFGSDMYSFEELVAEMGSAYLCSFTGILNKQIMNSAAYMAGWVKKLKDDKKLIIKAAGNAQKAVDYILNYKDSESGNEVEQSEMIADK